MLCALNLFVLQIYFTFSPWWAVLLANKYISYILLCHMHHTNIIEEVNAQIIPTSKHRQVQIIKNGAGMGVTGRVYGVKNNVRGK